MASELVNTATSNKLAEVDWTKNIEICELVANDPRQAKDVIKAIKKRLGSKNSNSQLYAVMLLEVLMNNIGEAVHKQVVELGILPILVKIVKKKSDLPVRGRIFLLLDAAQTSVGGAAGKFPQYYKAYYDLVSAGVKFPQRSHPVSSNTNPSSSSANHNNMTIASIVAASQRAHKPEESQPAPGLSIIEKATAALEVLREVLNAVIAQNPEAAKDEFTLDLVEQCSFQKDRVMHLVMSSRDEKLVSRAIELNEQLGSVLAKHAALLSHVPASTSTFLEHDEEPTLDEYYHRSATWVSNNSNHVGRRDSNHSNHVRNWGTWASNHNYNAGQPALTPNHFSPMGHEEIEEEEETSQLSRRIRKGKTLVRPEDEENAEVRPFGVVGASVSNERLLRPLIRPSESPPHEIKVPPSAALVHPSAALVPPPPSKHVERERFFQEKGDGTLSGHMRGLSLHSRNGSMSSFNASSSSYNGSMSSRE